MGTCISKIFQWKHIIILNSRALHGAPRECVISYTLRAQRWIAVM